MLQEFVLNYEADYHFSFREQGWRSRESALLSPKWPGFKSRRRRHIWVEFVVGPPLCSERFRVLRSSPLLKNQHFQIRSGMDTFQRVLVNS